MNRALKKTNLKKKKKMFTENAYFVFKNLIIHALEFVSNVTLLFKLSK